MAQISLQNRFLWVAIPLLAILGGIIYYSQSLVNETATQSIQSVAEIRQMERGINEIRSSLQSLEQLVYQRTVISYRDKINSEQRINEQIAVLNAQIRNFITNPNFHSDWQEADKKEPDSFAALTVELKQTSHRMLGYINHYNLLINDVRLRFPSSKMVIEDLFPLNNAFSQEMSIALEEVGNLPPTLANLKTLGLLKDLRNAWIQQISLFRMFVANRSGMFDTPESAMTANLQDRELYMEKVNSIISKLEMMDKAGKIPFQTAASLETMRNIYAQFEETFAGIKKTYMSDNWRIDHNYLHTRLQPVFKKATRIIDSFSNKIKTYATETITSTQSVASKITSIIWLIGGALVGLTALSYLVFERLVRRPVLVVADAMNAEASGESFFPILGSSSKETDLLLEAFHNMQEQVHSRQTRLESILGSAAEGIITADETGIIESFNSAAEKLFGYKAEEVIGENINILIPNKFHQPHSAIMSRLVRDEAVISNKEIEVSGQRKDGSVFPVSIKLSEMVVGGNKLYTAVVDDVSERTEMIKNLRNLAEHDSLTGLYNRYFFLQELDRVVQRSARGTDVNVALLYIDLDNFKFVNDTMGHLAGDKLLNEVANMLRKRGRETDLVARIGGDEFAIIIYDVDEDGASKAGDSFRHNLQNFRFNYDGKVVDIGCSVGIAMVEKGINKDELLARADFSCHAAKRSGRNKIHLYTEIDKQNLENLSDDMGWVRRIKDAIKHDRFMFVVQPIVQAGHEETNCYEVLLRMLDNNGKFIMPAGFIPPAERFGLMTDIDKWVVNHAIDYLANEKENGGINLSINLSAPSFSNKELLTLITEKIREENIDPTSITFEITETVAMADLELTVTFLDKLRALGCYTALDDFGVGYSSFAYLKDLPVDYVKIDGSFVRDIDTNELNKAIVKSMNDVAQAMGKQTVAEFVENQEVRRILELIGVDFLQGYYIGKPELPAFEKRRMTISSIVNTLPKSSSL